MSAHFEGITVALDELAAQKATADSKFKQTPQILAGDEIERFDALLQKI